MAIVNFLTTTASPIGSWERNAAFICGHIGFFFFNFVNVGYILLYEGYALGRLRNNLLTKIALVGCVAQIVSCITSI